MLVEALHGAGVPPDALALLPGYGEAGAALVRDPRVHLIAFTGSSAVGLEIIRAAAETPDGQGHVKRVIAEMGGKNCVIVDSDADLDDAIPAIVASAFGYAGQKCSATARVLAHEAIADALLERLAGAADTLVVGQAEGFATDVPPLIEREAQEARRRLPRARRPRRPAAHRAAGRCPTRAGSARPAVATGLPPDSALLREEVFGPLLTVEPVAGIEEALDVVEALPFALTGGLYSRNPRDDRPRPRAHPGRQPLRQLDHHRGDGRPPAVRRQPALRGRLAGRRARLPPAVHRAARGQREHDAPRARDRGAPEPTRTRRPRFRGAACVGGSLGEGTIGTVSRALAQAFR